MSIREIFFTTSVYGVTVNWVYEVGRSMSVEYSVEDEVATIQLNRPNKKNALTSEVFNELHAALEAGERESRVAVLTGAGDAFCAGADLKESVLSSEMSIDDLERYLSRAQTITRTIRSLSIPVVTRINGPAMGAGCDIALAGDFRIAGESALFCESFVNVGVVSGDGGAFLLPRLVDEATAKEMLLLGKEIPGSEAADVGLVNETVPDSELDDTVDEYIDRLLSLPPTALGRNKQLVNKSYEHTMDESFGNAIYAMWVCLQSRDFEEARQAFNAGREPEFSP